MTILAYMGLASCLFSGATLLWGIVLSHRRSAHRTSVDLARTPTSRRFA